MSVKCDCSRASDDPQVGLQEHTEECAHRKDWEDAKAKSFMITRERVLCPVHGEPFREKWPIGFPTFSVKAFQKFTAIAGVWDEARRLGGFAADAEMPIKALEPVLDVRPVCCRVSKSALVELYVASGIGVDKRCKVCGRKRLGTPVSTSNMGYLKHICFTCIASASETPQNVQ